MEKIGPQKLIKALESTDSSVIYAALVQIRTKLITTREGIASFRQYGGIKLILDLLCKPNEKITNISLSILGNCCTEPETRDLVAKIGGLKVLIKILHCLDGSGIKSRCYRTIANISQDRESCQYFHSKGVPLLFLKEFETCTDEDSRSILARAFRILADNDEHMTVMIKNGVIRHLVSQLNATNLEVLKVYLKSFVHFTSGHYLDYEKQVLEHSDKLQSLIALTTSESKCTRELALCALINLTKQAGLRPHLGSIGLIPVIIKEINQPSVKHPSQVTLINALGLLSKESVNRVKIRENEGLKLFLKFLKDESFGFLHCHIIKILMNYKYDTISLLFLTHYGLIKVLVQQLTFYINDNLGEHDSTYVEKSSIPSVEKSTSKLVDTEKKELKNKTVSGISGLQSASFRVNSPSYQAVQDEMLVLKKVFKDDRKDQRSFDWNCSSSESSPYLNFTRSSSLSSPSLTLSPCSPPSSGRSSPWECTSDTSLDQSFSDSDLSNCNSPTSSCSNLTRFEFSSKHSTHDVGRYSPVLPDQKRQRTTEKDSEENENICKDAGILTDSFLSSLATPICSKATSKEESLYPETKKTETEVQSSVLWIFALLCHFSQLSTPPADMISSFTLSTLLRYLTCTPHPLAKGGKILLRLCSNCFCLKSLLLSGFVVKIVKQLLNPRHKACEVCNSLVQLGQALLKELSRTTEDGYAIGEIESIFLHGTREERNKFILGLSCIVRNKRVTNILYHKHKALDFLFELFDDHEELLEVVTAVHQLALNLGIQETYVKNIEECPIPATCNFEDPSPNDCITFTFGEESYNIKASRHLICQQSDVFRAMLVGNFSEGHQPRVNLTSTTSDVFTYFIHHCSGCHNCAIMETIASHSKHAVQLFQFSDTYMLKSLGDKIFSILYKKHLGGEHLNEIYEIASQHYLSGTSEVNMSEAVIKYVIVSSMTIQNRTKCFRVLLSDKLIGEHFLSNLRIILEKSL